MSSCTNSASLGWSGKESDEVLQVFTAHVRKLRVSTFMARNFLAVFVEFFQVLYDLVCSLLAVMVEAKKNPCLCTLICPT